MVIFASSQNLLPGLCLADCDWAGNQAGLKSLESLQGRCTCGCVTQILVGQGVYVGYQDTGGPDFARTDS